MRGGWKHACKDNQHLALSCYRSCRVLISGFKEKITSVTVQIESDGHNIHGMFCPVNYSLGCWHVCEERSIAWVESGAVRTKLPQMHTPSHILIERAVSGTQNWLRFGACYENMTLWPKKVLNPEGKFQMSSFASVLIRVVLINQMCTWVSVESYHCWCQTFASCSHCLIEILFSQHYMCSKIQNRVYVVHELTVLPVICLPVSHFSSPIWI